MCGRLGVDHRPLPAQPIPAAPPRPARCAPRRPPGFHRRQQFDVPVDSRLRHSGMPRSSWAVVSSPAPRIACTIRSRTGWASRFQDVHTSISHLLPFANMRMDEGGALEVARGLAALLRAERFDDVVGMFAPPLRAAVAAEALRFAWTAEAARHGRSVKAIGEPATEPAGGRCARVPVICDDGASPWSCRWWRRSVARSAARRERRRRVATAALRGHGPVHRAGCPGRRRAAAVPGTMSLPAGPGPWPAVVLLSGGGAFDRDETQRSEQAVQGPRLGARFPTGGRAAFDKVTFAHPDRLPPEFTMADEYLPHALAAVQLLRQRPDWWP